MASTVPSLPTAKVIQVDTRGAVILVEESPDTKDSRGIYLPNHIEPISHIAIDIGGSLAKVVYFTRSPQPPSSPSLLATNGDTTVDHSDISSSEDSPSHSRKSSKFNGALTPAILEQPQTSQPQLDSLFRAELLRRASLKNFPGGSLNFERFETDNIDHYVEFVQQLIERSAKVNGVSIEQMKRGVQIIATGGGAHKFNEVFHERLDMKIEREDEMDCLITGMKFISHIPDEVYYFSDELIHIVTHPEAKDMMTNGLAPLPQISTSLERPSPNPPQYSVSFEEHLMPQLPCLLVNIGSGVSIIKIDEDGQFERISGTSLGGGTLWGLLSLLTGAATFDEMLALSEKGDNATVDMLVGDIYGQDYSRLGLKNTMIASSFGKVFRKGGVERKQFSNEDISKSLLYAISNNIGQIAYMNAEKYNLDKIYFGGFFIRGHPATIATLSYAIRFWSKGTKRALFLRHEGFLGAIGAWVKRIETEQEEADYHEEEHEIV